MEYVCYFFTCLKNYINNTTIHLSPSGVLLLILKITLFVYHVGMLSFFLFVDKKTFYFEKNVKYTNFSVIYRCFIKKNAQKWVSLHMWINCCNFISYIFSFNNIKYDYYYRFVCFVLPVALYFLKFRVYSWVCAKKTKIHVGSDRLKVQFAR